LYFYLNIVLFQPRRFILVHKPKQH